MSSLADRIRQARIDQGLDIAEVARRANVDREHLSRFERGARDMSSSKIDRVLAALGLEVVANEHDDTPDLEDPPSLAS